MALAQMEVAKRRRAFQRGMIEILLFDVHMVGIEVQFQVGLADAFNQFKGLIRRVYEEGLVAVDSLDADRDAQILANRRLFKYLGGAFPILIAGAACNLASDGR